MGHPSWRPLGRLDALAVGVGALLGAGVFFLPKRVENLAGPTTPLAYLLATVAALSVALGFAVVASSPLGRRDGGVYLAVSRVWESRLAGFLVAWVGLGAYVGLLALLARAVAGSVSSVATRSPVPTVVVSLAVLGVVLSLHLVPRVAGGVQVVLSGALVALVVVLVVPSLVTIVPGNFDPLLPTPALREDPFGSLWRATLAATFGFLGLEAAVAVGGSRDPPEKAPQTLLVAVAAVGLLTTLGALAVLGTIPWSRLVFAPVPLLDTAESTLGLPSASVLALAGALATLTALVALVWAPSRLLATLSESIPPLGHTNRFGAPDVALGVLFGSTAAFVVADAVEYALFLTPTGFVVLYLAHTISTAALPFVRPALYEACTFRPRPTVLVVAGVVGTVAMGGLGLWTLQLDPVTTLGFTRHSPSLEAVALGRLLQDPTQSVVPAFVGWVTAGVATFVVARDYRLSVGVEDEPLAAAYETERADSDGSETVDETEGTDRNDENDEHQSGPTV
jgi:APA family basic amino acid/polyamine antiporter